MSLTFFEKILVRKLLQDHNCVRELRSVVQQQQTRLSDLQMDVNDIRVRYTELRREVRAIKVCAWKLHLVLIK